MRKRWDLPLINKHNFIEVKLWWIDRSQIIIEVGQNQRCKEACYDPKGEYIGLNVYDMTPRGGIYGVKCTCNV
jgi:hypothetical protein